MSDTLTAAKIGKMSKAEVIELLDEEEIEYNKRSKLNELRDLAIEELIGSDDDEDDEELEDDEDEAEDEDVEDDDLDLEDLDEDDEEPAPKAKGKKAAAKKKAPAKPKVEFGAREAAEYISSETGKNYDPRQLRVLLRKMAKDGRIDRDPEKDARSRYSWSGPDDAEIQAILAAVQEGEIEKASKESLSKLKADKAAKGDAPAKKTRKAKKAAPVDEDEDLEDDLDEDDLEDLD